MMIDSIIQILISNIVQHQQTTRVGSKFLLYVQILLDCVIYANTLNPIVIFATTPKKITFVCIKRKKDITLVDNFKTILIQSQKEIKEGKMAKRSLVNVTKERSVSYQKKCEKIIRHISLISSKQYIYTVAKNKLQLHRRMSYTTLI